MGIYAEKLPAVFGTCALAQRGTCASPPSSRRRSVLGVPPPLTPVSAQGGRNIFVMLQYTSTTSLSHKKGVYWP